MHRVYKYYPNKNRKCMVCFVFVSDFLDFSVFMCVFLFPMFSKDNNLLFFYLLKNMFYVAVLSELCLKYIQEGEK